jgi:hypothetical protein
MIKPKAVETARSLLFVLLYALIGAALVGSVLFVPSVLLAPEATGRSTSNMSIAWIGVYLGFIIGWTIGWHRLKEKRSRIAWHLYRPKTTLSSHQNTTRD